MHNSERVEIGYVSLSSHRETVDFLRGKLLPLVNAGALVLDAGCGEHNRLIDKRNVGKLIGCDVNEDAIQRNKSISEGIVRDLENLDFSDNTFDLLMSYDVIEHIERPELFIEGVARMLKKRGRLFLVTPNRNSIFGIVARVIPCRLKKILLRLL